MASALHFPLLRDEIARKLGVAIAAGMCDTAEALLLMEDVIREIEQGTDETFNGADLVNFAERLLRMAQGRKL